MPVHKCSNGKWRIGEGECKYDSKEKAEKAYRAYLAQKNKKNEKMLEQITQLKNAIQQDLKELKRFGEKENV